MFSVIKAIVVESLRASNNPELARIADWVADAETALIKSIAKIIAGSLRSNNGQISEDAARKIVEIKGTAKDISSTPEKNIRSATPFLDQYVELLNYISFVGSWRHSLLLDGFLHSSDCSSLWLFSMDKDPVFQINKGMFDATESCILLSASNVEIYLLPKMKPKELTILNEELGLNKKVLPDRLTGKNRQQVLKVYDDDVEVRTLRYESKKNRRGYMEEEVIPEDVKLSIDKINHSGIQALVKSFSPAIYAQEKSLSKLSQIVNHNESKP